MADPEPPPPDAPQDEELLAAFIGPSWRSHYQQSFTERAAVPGRWYRFNWAAALAPFWLAWRGLWLLQLASMLAFVLLAVAVALLTDDNQGWMSLLVAYAVLGAGIGTGADALLHARATRRLARIRARGLGPDEALRAMRRAGGVSVLGVILLPLIALLIFTYFVQMVGHGHPHQAYVAQMRSDLRNLVTAQESYFADNVTYGTVLRDSNVPGTVWFTSSTGVTITMGPATGTGWSATATHRASDQVCGIFVGDVPPPIRGGLEGEPKCEQAPEAHRH